MTQSIENLLNDVSLELKTLAMARQRYARQLAPDFSVFNYIYTDEMMLSRIIADLLNPQGDHAQGAAFLKLFISLLLDEDLTHPLLLETAEVSTEVQTLYIGKTRRMDIYIKTKMIDSEQSFGLCIENKPFAADQKDQLQDYAAELAKRHSIKSKDDPNWHLVYLNSDGTDPSEYSVKTATLEQWKHQGCFSNLNYPQLIEWLNQCKAVSQNPRVNTFLDAFATYIMQKFSGFKDMSEQDSLSQLIFKNNDHYKAFEQIYRFGVTLKKELNQQLKDLSQHFNLSQFTQPVSMKFHAHNDLFELSSCLFFDFNVENLKVFIDIYVYPDHYAITIAERGYRMHETLLIKNMLDNLGYATTLTVNDRLELIQYCKDVNTIEIKDFTEQLIRQLDQKHSHFLAKKSMPN